MRNKLKSIIKEFLNWDYSVTTIFSIVFIINCIIVFEHTIDDAYISFRYVENFNKGVGIVYNAGEYTEGYTNFLWILVLAVLAKTGIALETISKFAGISFSIITLFLFHHYIRYYIKDRIQIGIIIAFISFSPIIVINSIDGLETSLFMCLTLWTWGAFIKEVQGEHSLPISMFAAMLCYLTRPDGILWAGLIIILGLILYFMDSFPPKNWKRWFFSSSIVLLIVLFVHIIWRIEYYGDLFPNTYYAKGGGEWWQIKNGIYKIGFFIIVSGFIPIISTFIFIFKPISTVSKVTICFIVIRLLFIVWSGGEVMGTFRFLSPILPLIYLLCGIVIFNYIKKNNVNIYFRTTVFTIIFSTMAFSFYFIATTKLAYSNNLKKAHIVLGHFLNSKKQKNDLIACGDAGAIPFYSQMRTIDLWGLNDPHLGRLNGRHMFVTDANYIFRKNPTYIVIPSRISHEYGLEARFIADSILVTDKRFNERYDFSTEYEFSTEYILQLFVRKDHIKNFIKK